MKTFRLYLNAKKGDAPIPGFLNMASELGLDQNIDPRMDGDRVYLHVVTPDHISSDAFKKYGFIAEVVTE